MFLSLKHFIFHERNLIELLTFSALAYDLLTHIRSSLQCLDFKRSSRLQGLTTTPSLQFWQVRFNVRLKSSDPDSFLIRLDESLGRYLESTHHTISKSAPPQYCMTKPNSMIRRALKIKNTLRLFLLP